MRDSGVQSSGAQTDDRTLGPRPLPPAAELRRLAGTRPHWWHGPGRTPLARPHRAVGSGTAAQPACLCPASADRPRRTGAPATARDLPHRRHEAAEEPRQRRRTGQGPVIEEGSPWVDGTGSKHLFDQFFNELHDEAVGFVTSVAPDLDVADIVQQVFTEMLRKWHTIQNPRAYLYTALKNEALKRRRKLARDFHYSRLSSRRPASPTRRTTTRRTTSGGSPTPASSACRRTRRSPRTPPTRVGNRTWRRAATRTRSGCARSGALPDPTGANPRRLTQPSVPASPRTIPEPPLPQVKRRHSFPGRTAARVCIQREFFNAVEGGHAARACGCGDSRRPAGILVNACLRTGSDHHPSAEQRRVRPRHRQRHIRPGEGRPGRPGRRDAGRHLHRQGHRHADPDLRRPEGDRRHHPRGLPRGDGARSVGRLLTVRRSVVARRRRSPLCGLPQRRENRRHQWPSSTPATTAASPAR
ncbi:RNA polymerase sigma factor [Streptomyces sp. NPDC058964]|uniref:RNA polymerase sigma factor n=1 Tax=Streptomyces sp. NPDC058964 TaxID=3346681 RepID=UPI0036B7F0DB